MTYETHSAARTALQRLYGRHEKAAVAYLVHATGLYVIRPGRLLPRQGETAVSFTMGAVRRIRPRTSFEVPEWRRGWGFSGR